jgi:hypothetical protein
MHKATVFSPPSALLDHRRSKLKDEGPSDLAFARDLSWALNKV